MNFEKPNSLYPERASSNMDAAIARLQDIESGKIKKLELSEKEMAELLSLENKLGEKLEGVVKIKNIYSTIHIDYVLTPDGAEDFKKVFGIDISGEAAGTVGSFLCKNRDIFLKINPEERTAFSGRAEKFADAALTDELLSSMDPAGEINIADKNFSKQISFLLTPEKALKKLTLLRDFKRELKANLELVKKNTDASPLEVAKSNVLALYKKKVNQLLAENFSNGVLVKNLANDVEDSALTPEEKDLLTLYRGLSDQEKNYSRYDKFIHGASATYAEAGNKNQIPQELIDFANEIDVAYLENELNKESKIREKGLDPKKIFEKNISCKEFSAIEESLLDHYGNLSAYPASEYDPDGVGPAPDDKWRFIARPEIKSMSVNGSRKVIKAPDKNQSIDTTIAVLCGHETEGHFIQSINREKIPLKLISSKHLGSDRTGLFSEGGAMMMQDIISQEAFGFRTIPHSSYIRAMLKKLEGGNYIDCVKTFYDNQKAVFLEKKRQGKITDVDFQKKLRASLELSISRSKRLFRDALDKKSTSSFLARSKDTVYLEQLLLMNKLRQQGMEKYAFIGSINLNTLASLAEIGMIDLSQIQKPRLHSLEIWNKLKEKYKLTSKENSSSLPLDKNPEIS